MNLLRAFLMAVAACMPLSAASETVPLPTASEYWSYNSWYLDHAVVDLFVSGTDGKHIERVLSQLPALTARQIGIRRIIVVGGNSFAQLDASAVGQDGAKAFLHRISNDLKRKGKSVSPGEIASVQRKLGLSPTLRESVRSLGLIASRPVARPKDLLAKLQITYSPTWVVTYRGASYIYEGAASIESLFSESGGFSGATGRGTRQQQRTSQVFDPTSAMEYKLRRSGMRPGAGTFDVKPNCSESGVRETPVLYDSEHLSAFDLLYYNHRSTDQSANARSWKALAVPYLEGDLRNPYRTRENLLQEYGRFFDVRCLPTRVRFIYRDGRRYEEYREGEKAWEN